jgi:hypothetical protein
MADHQPNKLLFIEGLIYAVNDMHREENNKDRWDRCQEEKCPPRRKVIEWNK